MKFSESYIGKIRQKIGHDRLITATADVVAISSDKKVCVVYNKDFDSWGLPAGHVEIGDSWQSGAARELLEEAGLQATPSDLIPFATVSGKGYMHDYPNGDLVAPFTVVFCCEKFIDTKNIYDNDEIEKVAWYSFDEALKLNLCFNARAILEAYKKYTKTHEFQSIIIK